MNFKSMLAVALIGFGLTAGVNAAKPTITINGPHAALPCASCHTDGTYKAPAKNTCFQCHGSYAKVAERTAKIQPNPHLSHRGEKDCNSCHSMHAKPRFECNDCHNFVIRMKGE